MTSAADVVAKAQAVLSEAELLRAMFDVGYFAEHAAGRVTLVADIISKSASILVEPRCRRIGPLISLLVECRRRGTLAPLTPNPPM